jgi:hypothetical protein
MVPPPDANSDSSAASHESPNWESESNAWIIGGDKQGNCPAFVVSGFNLLAATGRSGLWGLALELDG